MSKRYKVGDIRTILEQTYEDPILRRTTVPLFISDPGQGKSQIIEEFMKEKGVYRPPFVLSQRLPYELSGMAIANHSVNKMQYYDFDFLLELKDGDILFLDETLNALPQTIAAMLTFLESRVTISGKKLPDIMIIGAANPQGQPVLTPQIKRRFLYYHIDFDKDSWVNYINNNYKIKDINLPKRLTDSLCRLIENETFSGENYNTPADLDKAIYSVIKGYITPYEDILTPILKETIKNPLDGDIELPDGELIVKEGTIPWLNLKKIVDGIINK